MCTSNLRDEQAKGELRAALYPQADGRLSSDIWVRAMLFTDGADRWGWWLAQSTARRRELMGQWLVMQFKEGKELDHVILGSGPILWSLNLDAPMRVALILGGTAAEPLRFPVSAYNEAVGQNCPYQCPGGAIPAAGTQFHWL